MKMLHTYKPQRGLTLIEIMIALLIGVFLTVGILQIFASSKQAYRLQENLSRLQENGRFAIDFITKDVRMAGFAGCMSKATVAITNSTDVKSPNPNPATFPAVSTGLIGNENITNNWSTLACGASNECVTGTDALSLQSASSCGAQLTGNTIPDNANIQIPSSNTCGIAANDVLLISDCTKAELFVATNASNGSGKQTVAHANNQNLQAHLTNSFGNDAELFVPKLISYFIRIGTSGGAPSLYRVDNTKAASGGTNPVELIEGIENMQVLYGVDSDATQDFIPNYYVDASQVTDWTKVISVRINLLAVTIDNNLTDQPQPYTYNGTRITPTDIFATTTNTSQVCAPPYTGTAPNGCTKVKDLRIHRAFSSTIAIRNRLP